MASRREGSAEEDERFPLSESSKKAHDAHLSRLQSFVVPEKGKDDDVDTRIETLDPYSRFRRGLLLSVRPNEPQRRRVLWESLGLCDPDYYVLVAVHIFKNTTGTLNETEALNANTGLSKDLEIVRLLAQICSHIRSLIGIKAWHEATSICWNLAHAAGPADATNEPSKALPDLSQTKEKVRETAQRLKVEDMVDTNAILIEGRKNLTHFKLEVQAPKEFFADAEPSTSGSNSRIRLGVILQSVRDLFDEGATMAKALLELIEAVEQFELVGQILEFRNELRQQAKGAKLESYKNSRMAEPKAQENPNVGQSIVVQSSSQAELKKEIRREQKRNKRDMSRIQNAFGEDELLELELAQKEQLRERQRELAMLKWGPTIVAGQQPKEVSPFVFDSQRDSQSALVISGNSVRRLRKAERDPVDRLRAGVQDPRKLADLRADGCRQDEHSDARHSQYDPPASEALGKRLAPLGVKDFSRIDWKYAADKEGPSGDADVVTRKTGDDTLTSFVKLLIIDEVHLLHDDRGPVIEKIVAWRLRQASFKSFAL
ncbi:unnamed protein product, partial [Mesorhabditis spiculigera]